MTPIKNDLRDRLIGLVVGLLLNASGNALAVSANMGSGLWTASAVNLSHWLGVNIGVILMIIGVLNTLTNQVLIRHWDIPRLVGEIIYAMFFSYFVSFFVSFFDAMGVGGLNLFWRTLLSIGGIIVFCIGISLYQRANIVMHPNDDTTNILRFLYLKGNATASQLVDFISPLIAIAVAFVGTHEILSVNVGTLCSIVGNGFFIATADKLVWPHLTHNFRTKQAVHG